MLIAKVSNICSGVSWAMIDGDAVWVGVPKLPSRSSVAPDRKKLRQTAFSAPYASCSRVSAYSSRAAAWFLSVKIAWSSSVAAQRKSPSSKAVAGDLDDPVDATHRVDVARPDRLRRVRPQPARVAVEPAHVALVDRLDVVADRAVVAVGVPRLLQRGRHLEGLGDLDPGVALVELAQRLVVQIGVQIPLQRKEFDDPLLAPGRPVVRGEHHVGAVGERVDRLGEVARPPVRVAHQRAAQRQQVVQVVGGVLGHAQRAEPREVEVHLGGRLGAGRHLELDLDAVDGVRLAGFADVERRHDQRDLAGRADLPQPAAHLSLRSARQHGAVHVGGPPRHRGAGVDVLLHGVLGEVLRAR